MRARVAERQEGLAEKRSGLSDQKRAILEKLMRSRAEKARAAEPARPAIPRRGSDGPAVLSFGQERLWFLDRLTPGTHLYNIPAALRLDGRLDRDALWRSLDEIVRRHEVLRTAFAGIGGEPRQAVLPAAPLPRPVLDLAGLPQELAEAEARRLSEVLYHLPFDLAEGRPLRAALIRLAEASWTLELGVHHIVSDGLSMNLLVRELAALYEAFVHGRPSPLAELPIQYADYAEWQRRWLAGEVLEAHLSWWKRELDGAPTLLDLPLDRPRPAVRSSLGAGLLAPVPADVAGALSALGQSEGATPFMVVLAAFQALLGRYTGGGDVLVGSPVADRPRPETQGLIGFFVNTAALRGRLSGAPSFRALVGRTRESVLGAFGHQELPFERLVDELGEGRTLGYNPLFQAAVSMLNAEAAGTLELPGLRLSPLVVESNLVKFDLSLSWIEAAGRAVTIVDYAVDIFDRSTAARIQEHFGALLAGAAADPDRPPAELPLLGDRARHQLLVEWNDTRAAAEEEWLPAHRRFERQVERAPGAPAVLFDGEALTYAELDRRAGRLAARLRELGAGPEARVGLFVERSLDLAVGILGIWKAGGAYVPLDPGYPVDRLSYLLEDSGAAVVLTRSALQARLPAAARTLLVDDVPSSAAAFSARSSPADLAYLIYTSGTTGRPKAVMVEHGHLAQTLAACQQAFDFQPGDRVPCVAPFSFDIFLFELLNPLLAGGAVEIFGLRPTLDVERLARALDGATHFHAVPALMRQVVDAVRREARPERRAALRELFVGGDAVPAELLAEMAEVFPSARASVLYGPTEATILCSRHRVRPGDFRPLLGRPLCGAALRLADPAGQEAPIGVAGELWIGGGGVARGYLGRPDLTADRFVPQEGGAYGGRWYRSGDLARRLPDGTFEFLGRADRQVKIRGFRVELGEIEAALASCPGVREAAALALDGEGGKRLVAVVAGEGTGREGLRDRLLERLPPFMVPSAFVVLDALPVTAHGKVDRRALERLAASGAVAGAESGDEEPGAPRSPAEEMLAGIWHELLGAGRIRPAADFFDLGGHSLLATRLVSRAREVFGVELPLRDVFQFPALATMAARLEELRRESAGLGAPPVSLALKPLSPAERGPRPPLSFAQERLWFLDRLDPGAAIYNVPAALRVRGAPDLAVLAACLREIARRHEVLRTTFDEDGGVPFQVVAPEPRVALRVVDLAALPATLREGEALRRLGEDVAAPFDLARGPLLRTLLVRLQPDEWAILLNLHHIVSDGWSLGVMTAELGALYEAFSQGRPSPLPELPVQYADFAVWQRSWLAGEVLAAQIAYWRERLAGVRPVLDLPADRPRPAIQSFRGGNRPVELGAALAGDLRAASRREGVTLFMTLLAGLQAVLHRYTGQEDILVGTPVAGRSRREIEGLVGFFVNVLVLRGELQDPAPGVRLSFRELLGRVRASALGAYAHQDLPFERLVDELKIERSLARSPLYQVVLALNARAAELRLTGLVLSPLGVPGGSAKTDLLLALGDAGEGELSGGWEYSAGLFDATTVDRLTRHLAHLLRAAAADPGRAVAGLPLLAAEEAAQILREWNDTRELPEPDLCLHQLFETWAERAPERIAAVFGEESLTYGELEARSNRLAHRLRRQGVGPETLAGIRLDRGLDRLVAVMAVLKAGGAYVPLDPSHPRERLAILMDDARPRVLLTRESLEGLEGEDPGRPESTSGPDNLAYVIYTSGSTGRPNGVLVSHRSAVNLIRRAIGHFRVDADSRVMQSVSFSFDASVLETWIALGSGATLCVARRETLLSGEALAGMIRRHRISVMVSTPSVLNTLPAEDLPSLRAVSVGGDSSSGELVSRWAPPASGLERLYNCYGPTEATIYASLHPCQGVYRKEPPIGRAVGNARLYILDFHGQPVPAGVAGILWVAGAGVARGYLDRPRLTAERFAPDPYGGEPGGRMYRTGDLARWTADGNVEFLGRIDRQVKIRGLRMELGEIEAALASHPGVRDQAVIVREDGGAKRLAAYVVAREGEPARPQELREHLRGRLPEYMIPASVVFVDALPVSPTGKVDRAALLHLAARPPEPSPRAEPRDVVELELARIWSDVLGVPGVGIRDNFFEAGGHSLLAVRLVAQIQQSFGRELPLTVLFQGGTVEEMAALLRGGTSAARSSCLVPIRAGGDRPPLFCVHPAGGDVLCFAALSRHLGPGQPFYGLQSRGLSDGAEPLARIEDMAALYLEEMRRAQPAGPYRIGGWSLGGVIAFEMARQLQRRGEEAALVAIFDSVPDLSSESEAFQSDIDFLVDMAAYVEGLWGKDLGLAREELERVADPEARVGCLAERLRAADFLPPGAGVEQLRRILQVYRTNVASASSYRPAPYDGRLTLFKAAEVPGGARGTMAEPDLGWGRFASEPVDVRVVPGRHLTLLAEPNVRTLARELENALTGIGRSARSAAG